LKILIALSFSPYPVRRGTDRLIVNLIRGLLPRNEVRLVTMVLDRERISGLREFEGEGLTVDAMVAPHRRSFLHKVFFKIRNTVKSILSGIPVQTLYAAPRDYLNLVAETARRWNADLTIVNYWHLYRIAGMLEGRETVLLTHDLDFINCQDRIESATGWLRKAATGYRCRIGSETELKAYRSFEKIMTVTEKEADELRGYLGSPGKKIAALPMAMDLERFDSVGVQREKDRILIMGVFYSDFNRDSLLYFLDEIFPDIIASREKVNLEIVGPGVPRRLMERGAENMLVRGRVDNVIPFLKRCSVMVLPLRYAGGVRIRMLEAAAAGIPVVSTSTGVKGLELRSGREYIRADDPSEFAGAVVKILEDRKLAEKIGNGARRWAEKNISLASYPRRLESVLRDILD